MENTEYNVPEVEETDSQYSETGKYGDGVPIIDSSDIEEKVESDSGSWQDAIDEATEDRIQYDFSADDDTDDVTEENAAEDGDTVVEPSLEDVVKSRLEDTRADIVEDVDNIFANIVMKFEDAGGSFENETGDELVKNAEEEFGIDDADYGDTDSSFDKIVVLKEAVIAKRLREAEGQLTVEEALKKADKKDWDRALANYSNAQIESMFNKITDPRKKIGRAIAFYAVGPLTDGFVYSEYKKYIRDFIDESALNEFFGENKYDGLDYYSSHAQRIIDTWQKVKDIINASPEAISKFEQSYEKALKTLDQKAAEKKAAEMKAAAEKAKKEKETEWLKKQYQAAGAAVFEVSSEWHSFGGYIGQYGKVAYTPSGRKMSDEEIYRKIQKYDDENYYEPKYFAVAGFHGGYDRDFGVSYEGKEIYTLDIAKAYEDYIGYSSDGYLSIYKISKRIKMEESLEAENEDSTLTDFQKDVIKEIALADFECGHFTTAEFFLDDEEGDFAGAEQAAADYYQELVDMGPAGFYEEFKDELDFDPDFVAEYSDED